MSPLAESPVSTTLRFIEWWRVQGKDRLIAELVSLNRETHKKPDVYHFIVDRNTLIDPETGRSIFEFIAHGVEYDIAEKLKSWALENDGGVAFWISPRLRGVYPCNKIIIHTISYIYDRGKWTKVVLNCSILFDGQLDNPEELRKTLFTAPDSDETVLKIFNWIKKVSNVRTVKAHEDDGVRLQAAYFAHQIKLGIPQDQIIGEMQKTGFLGLSPISCPPSFSSLATSYSKIFLFEGKKILCCRCPFCGAEVAAEIYDGKIHCPSCGRSREWLG